MISLKALKTLIIALLKTQFLKNQALLNMLKFFDILINFCLLSTIQKCLFISQK